MYMNFFCLKLYLSLVLMSVMGLILLDYWEPIILNNKIRGNKLTNLGPILPPGSIIKKLLLPKFI